MADIDDDDLFNATSSDPTQDTSTDEIELEIIDDTPSKDKGVTAIDPAKAEPSDNEIEQYSDGVKNRIAKLNHAKEDQRRLAEQNARERDEALRVARGLIEQNKELQRRYSQGEEVYITQAREKAEMSLSTASRKYQDAYDAGDSAAMAAAQAEIADAAMAKREASRWQPTPQPKETALQEQENPVYSKPSVPKPDARATNWAEKNEWFGDWNGGYNEEMTAFAYGVHDKLTRNGVNPATDPDRYYQALDKRVREVFPEYEWNDAPRNKARTVVASVQRTPKGNKVTLNRSQLAIATKLGLTPLQYAQEVASLSKSETM